MRRDLSLKNSKLFTRYLIFPTGFSKSHHSYKRSANLTIIIVSPEAHKPFKTYGISNNDQSNLLSSFSCSNALPGQERCHVYDVIMTKPAVYNDIASGL